MDLTNLISMERVKMLLLVSAVVFVITLLLKIKTDLLTRIFYSCGIAGFILQSIFLAQDPYPEREKTRLWTLSLLAVSGGIERYFRRRSKEKEEQEKEEKMGTPGVCVIPKEDKNDRMASLLQKYDGKIKAKPYRYQDLIDFLDQNYDYLETPMSAWESENFQRSYEAELHILQEEPAAKFDAASFLMIRNERNEELWSAEPSEEEIKLFIEKNTGVLSANSIPLHAQLFLVRGVTQEDIDKVTKRYQDYLIYLDAQEDHFRSLIPPLA